MSHRKRKGGDLAKDTHTQGIHWDKYSKGNKVIHPKYYKHFLYTLADTPAEQEFCQLVLHKTSGLYFFTHKNMNYIPLKVGYFSKTEVIFSTAQKQKDTIFI